MTLSVATFILGASAVMRSAVAQQPCSAGLTTGVTTLQGGVTEAPDLLRVEGFRPGPETDDGNPTTCVDFVFDQPTYVISQLFSNFNLVPLDGSDALPGSTNVLAENDAPGDVLVTVVFPGSLTPAEFARGFVDTGTVNSDPDNVGSDAPANINQAAIIELNALTRTENPDLVSTMFQGRKRVRFTFDEALTTDDVVQNTGGLCVYFPSTSQSSTIPDACALKVSRVSSTTLSAKFGDLPEGYQLFEAVGAYVKQGAVQAAVGSRGGNDGTNAFDEKFLNIV